MICERCLRREGGGGKVGGRSKMGRDALLRLYLLDLFSHRRYHVEEIPHDANIGNLEYRRFSILVDSDDGPRTLHADDVLDGPTDSEREVELRSDCLSRRPDLAFEWQ